MTIGQVLQKNTLALKKAGISRPAFEAELIISFVLGKERVFILSHQEDSLPFFKKIKISRMLRRYIKGEPLAYLLNIKTFYGLDFFVNKQVLVPRPETELMLEEAVFLSQKIANKKNYKKLIIIDLGTGSACIIISLIKQLQAKKINLSLFSFFALDISSRALKVAKKNIKKFYLAKKVTILKSNLLQVILAKKKYFKKEINHFLICANLPYLTKEQINSSPSIQKEPIIALHGGKSGMEYYQKLFVQLKKISRKHTSFTLLSEIDPDQKQIFFDKIKKQIPNISLETKKDLSGQVRLIIANYNYKK